MGRILRLYQQHAGEWDDEFRRVRERYADRIHCGRGCSMCCSQMFSISTLEAYVIATAVEALPEADRDRLREKARGYVTTADQLGLLARQDGDESITPRVGARLPCPALQDDACTIYPARPLICRKWGIPVYDPTKPDRLNACELNFRSGESVESGDLVARQTRLLERWQTLKTRVTVSPRTFTVAEAILMEAPGLAEAREAEGPK